MIKFRFTLRTSIVGIFLLIYLIEISFSQCTYQAYESFDDSANQALNGISSGSGWAQPWSVQNDNTTIPGFQILANSLNYSNLQTLGNSESGGSTYLVAGRRLHTNLPCPFDNLVDDYQDGIGTRLGDTLWVSFVIGKSQNNNDVISADLHNSNIPWYFGTNEDFIGVGYYGEPFHVSNQKRWHLRINNSYYDSGVEAQIGTNYLMVLRLIFQTGNTQVNLYINPTDLGLQMPSTPTLSQNSGRQNIIRSLALRQGDLAGNGKIDEIRFATSYKCVTPDDEVTVNLPPHASFVASQTSANIPVNIQFDGSASSDPENQAISYTWNFGDGSSPVVGSSVISHTFDVIGQIPVSLTVTDNVGLKHTTYLYLNLLDQNNTFPCQSSFTVINMPSCNQNNGAIAIHANNNAFTLVNALQIPQTITNGNQYHNLSQGKYRLFVAGPVCRDTFTLHVTTDSTTCNGWQAAECQMDLGTNMNGFSDWSVERPLKNLFKHIRNEILTFSTTNNCWDCHILSELTMDGNGYPTFLPQTTSIGQTMVRYILSSEGGNLRKDSSYVLLYDGVGTVTMQGSVSVSSNAAGRIVFSPANNGNIWIHVESSQLGNHVKNIRLLKLTDEMVDLNIDPFYDRFKDKIAPFQSLRFMDWGNTNGNTNIDWSNRASITNYTYAGEKGVPYEMMIKLANELKKDIWVCVPHEANTNYITQMAQLFKDNLDGDLNIYLEYSNEVWNGIFLQAHYNEEHRPANLNSSRAMAAKAGHVFGIWHNVFGNEKCRVKRVLGIQASNNGVNEQILSQLKQDEWDFGSPTHYFGLDHSASGNPVLDGSSTVTDVMNNALNAWTLFKTSVKNDYNLIKLLGKKIITYEGGQHFVGNAFGISYPYQQAMWDAQNSSQMYEFYDRMHDTIRSWGCQMAVNFSLSSVQNSVFGSWGVMSDIDVQPPYTTTALKYQALLDNLPSVECRRSNTWNGSQNASWNNPCNWEKTKVPDIETDVVIPSGTPFQPQVDQASFAKTVNIMINASLIILTGHHLKVGP